MKTRRLLRPSGSLIEGTLLLSGDEAHYLSTVLRMRIGDAISLGDGSGVEGEGALIRLARDRVEIAVERVWRAPQPEGPVIRLCQAVGKAEKMERVLRLAAELGVRRLCPVLSGRSVPRGERKLDRWQLVADDSTRISGRAYRLEVEAARGLDELLGEARADLALVLAGAAERGLGSYLVDPPAGAVEILVGPEGGLSEEELEASVRAGFRPAHLGPHTIRTEHAGVVAAALTLFSGGGLGAATRSP